MKYLSQFFTVVGIDEYMTANLSMLLEKRTRRGTWVEKCAGGTSSERKGQRSREKLRVNKDVAACFNLQAIFLQMIARMDEDKSSRKNQ
jgi:hypothetical protein